MSALKRSLNLVLLGMLAACAAPPPNRGPAERAPAQPGPPAGAEVFRVDAEQSEIRVLVYRAATLANLGHNHVIVFHPSRGWIAWAVPLARSTLRIEVPVDTAQVDDPAMRREEGTDFPGEIDANAKSGTLHNMLSEALLDGGHFPAVIIAAGATGAAAQVDDMLSATLRLSVAGHESSVTVPVKVERSGRLLTASGSISLTQSDLGLKPFSIMLGALQVQDRMNVKFRIVANQ